jgi:ribA/ribD-fused uncharacterized protein
MSMITSFTGDYGFLSNFSPHAVRFKVDCMVSEVTWLTAEHAFHADKCVRASDAKAIWEAPTPAAAKRIGRRVDLRPGWDRARKLSMGAILVSKFTQHPDLGERLVATAPQILIEGNNWHDNFWGQCGCDDCCGRRGWSPPDVGEHLKYGAFHPGKNYLGRLLMGLRDILE